ncbi:MAG TPA: hypothetical protein VFP52_17100, partial [Myxococcales bacterium]|nr:hypothetical protein [Myxococcales bacterium]
MKPEIRAGLEQIVGVRKYVRKAPRGSSEVIVEVGLPQHLPAEEELSDWWACPLRIRGLGRPRELYAGGSDS